MKRAIRRLVPAAAAVFVLATPLGARSAGWLIEEVDRDFPDHRTVLFIMGDRARVDGLVDGLVFLADLSTGRGQVVDDERGVFAGGTMSEIYSSLRSRKALPAMAEESPPGGILPPLRVERLPGKENVAGHAAEGYRLFLGDLLVEELWVAPGVAPRTGGPGGSLRFMLDVMTGGAVPGASDFLPSYEEEDPYREILARGYPVRRVCYYRGETSVLEVVRAERREMPPGLFEVPPGFREETYRKVFFSGP